MLYQVNEQRTEYFRPSMSGTIIPLAPGGGAGGGGISLTLHVTVQGSVIAERELARTLAPSIRDAFVQIARQNGGNLYGGNVTS